MSIVDKLKFHAWDDVGAVASIIKKWQPKECKTEKDYERSLYTFLHERFGDVQITKQYAKGRIRADLVIADRVILELKNNLDSTAKYQRLVGQLSEYKDWDGRIIILLTGQTDPNLRKQLERHISREGLTGDMLSLFQGDKVTVIAK
jgi:hypothetical protein